MVEMTTRCWECLVIFLFSLVCRVQEQRRYLVPEIALCVCVCVEEALGFLPPADVQEQLHEAGTGDPICLAQL